MPKQSLFCAELHHDEKCSGERGPLTLPRGGWPPSIDPGASPPKPHATRPRSPGPPILRRRPAPRNLSAFSLNGNNWNPSTLLLTISPRSASNVALDLDN